MTFKAMKFRVESPEHSEKIQKVLFDMGYKWEVYPHKDFKFTSRRALTTHETGCIYWADAEDWHMLSKYQKEYTLKEIISYELVPVPTQKYEELIELNGLKYKKSELEEALKLIKPVGE